MKTESTARRAAAVIERLAAGQHGVVTRRQLLEAGVAAHLLDRRVLSGELRCLQRGVYQVGPIAGPRAREMAAVLASGPGALLSHWSAAALARLLPETPPADVPVDVVVAGRGRRPRDGIRLHGTRALHADEATSVDGVPVTTAARTLLDLAALAAARELEYAFASAERARLVTRAALRSLAARHPWHRGVRRLVAMLDRADGPALTRSEAERKFLDLLRGTGIPLPEVNVLVLGYVVDFLWRARRVVVEIDGFAFHGSRPAFHGDRRRDADLAAAGLRIIRVTWDDLVQRPRAVLVRVAWAVGPPEIDA